MNLDGFTLMAAGSFVAALSGLLLLVAWTQIRAPSLLWWSAASGIYAVGIGVLAFGITSGITIAVAIASGVTTLTPVLVFGGVRHFNRRPNRLLLLAAGPAVWAAAGAIPFPGGPEFPATVASFAIWVVYLGAAAVELWRGRTEPLPARWPLAGFFAIHGIMFFVGLLDMFTVNVASQMLRPFSSVFSYIHFEAIIYAVGTSVFMVLMCKERSERRHIIAARSDSLTGIANRGAFLESAERALRRCQAEGRSFSLIMFDLDRFKWINDSFGHDVGDEVLRTFADTTRSVLRPNDLFGRYGGEEFCVVLPGATIEAAYVIAERVRHKFAHASESVAGRKVSATASAGVATAASSTTLEAIMREADHGMYRAKSLGRNRVERADPNLKLGDDAVIRVA
jgi:diguanylate cyclase (GGDEF)-like protein